MITKIDDGFFRLAIPLPESPLKAVNVYVILGTPRSLIIDTGLDRDICEKAFRACLAEIGLDLELCDFFITHFHADHAGLVSRLHGAASRIHISRPDADSLADTHYWQKVSAYAQENGFPASEAQTAVATHPGSRYRRPPTWRPRLVAEGDRVAVGRLLLQVLETPGHTDGHLCLYEPKRGLLISGDLVLQHITPTIQSWRPGHNPLQDYFQSLTKIGRQAASALMPGHGDPIPTVALRIAQIHASHQLRGRETMEALAKGLSRAYDIAQTISWNGRRQGWDGLNLWHRLLALGETLAHLHFLEAKAVVYRRVQEKESHFFLVGQGAGASPPQAI